MNSKQFLKHPLVTAIATASLAGLSGISYAQEAQESEIEGITPPRPEPVMEEVVITARLKDSAESIIAERLEQAYAVDLLGVEQITRVGDSDVASALRRVTGLTLVDGKYIYVRGLGERYSSTTLNGTAIPSPELTRNVVPLDLFPTTILDSLKVQKAYSADQPAAFGGGSIDIRTRGVPEGLVFEVGIGSGWNSQSSSDGFRTLGDGGDLPSPIANALDEYSGNLSPNNISTRTGEDGAAINRDLMLTLNRDIELREESLDPDYSGAITLGNSWFVGNDFTMGALLNLEKGVQYRNEDQVDRAYDDPDNTYSEIKKTIREENQTLALNLGFTYQDKHFINTNSFVLENPEDQSAIVLGHNPDFLRQDGRQRTTYATRLEDRELVVNQIIGEHDIEAGDFGFVRLPEYIPMVNVNWYYSDAEASTNVPNATNVDAFNALDVNTGELLSTELNIGNSSQFNFLELEDEITSGGFHIDVPFEFDTIYGTFSSGYDESKKNRSYYGYTANINASALSPRAGEPSQVLSDGQISDPNNGFLLSMGSNFGTESYVAGETIVAAYGSVDMTFSDSWRLSAGVRWEEFKRGILPVDLLDYTGVTVDQLIEDLQEPNQTYAILEDDYYPAVALTYMRDGFLGADTFQLRFGYGKTVVRPDLREISDVQFIDPELNIRVQGNPNLVFSDIDHFDLRAEMFFPDGSNLTASLFYKDIANPIETVQRPGPQDARLLSYDNAESGEVYGIELEGLKELGMGFFVTGNVVLSDSELKFPENTSQTSAERRLTGHSEYVVNAMLGFDSSDGLHSLSAAYNVYGERIYYGGLSPDPDAYEQPFHSLDLVYSFYPTNSMTLKLKVVNILDESQTYEQEGIDGSDVTIIERDIGTDFSLDFTYSF